MKILVINGHPDPSPKRFAAALASAYAKSARATGHEVEEISVGAVDVGFLSNTREFATPAPADIGAAQQKIAAAEHVVLIYPLWLGTMPARLKAFLEQTARANFLLAPAPKPNAWPRKMMAGRSARVIVTMGMPGFVYRLFFGAHSLKALEGCILRMSGFRPVRSTVLGAVEASAKRRQQMLQTVARLGSQAR